MLPAQATATGSGESLEDRQRRIAEKLAIVERGAHLVEDALVQLGADEPSEDFTAYINRPYKELLEDALTLLDAD